MSTDDERFAEEALCWFDDIFRFAMMQTRNRADAEDLVQDTYLRCYQFWHAVQPGTDVRRWLFVICRECWIQSPQRMRRPIERNAASLESVLFLVDVEQQTYEATAEILGIPVDAVRSRLFRARRMNVQEMIR